MELEKQVCSRELSHRLDELGVKQDSYFHWHEGILITPWVDNCRGGGEFDYPAYTVAELGEMLPRFITNYDFSPNPNAAVGEYSLFYCPADNSKMHGHEVRYQYSPHAIQWQPNASPLPQVFSMMEKATTEADARAKMLVYLLENNLITL